MKIANIAVRRENLIVLAGAIAGLAAIAVLELLRPADSAPKRTVAAPDGWKEIPWPLPAEPWWPSKAFVCSAQSCGVPLTLYLRAKIGFCNCSTGVADDEELERIGDFGVLANTFAPVRDGRPIEVAWMKGRSRPYSMNGKAPAPDGATSALLVGYNDRCDAIVATAVPEKGEASRVEGQVLSFLQSPAIMRWAELTLGL